MRGEGGDPHLCSFDFIHLRLISNRVVETSVLPRANAVESRYISGCSTIVYIYSVHIRYPRDYEKGISTCSLVSCISVLSKLKRESTETTRGGRYPTIVMATKPRKLRVACVFLSICARLLELFACIVAHINPRQSAFNDTDATREQMSRKCKVNKFCRHLERVSSASFS